MNRPAAPPAYGALIEAAREAAGLSRREAARRAGISDAWWRYVVQGWQNGPISGPADTVAKMALVVGVTPEELETAGERADAARELRRLLQSAPAAEPLPMRPLAPYFAAVPVKDEVAEEILAGLLDRYGDNAVVKALGGQRGKDAGTRVVEILRFLKDPELDREVLARLLSLDNEVVQALGAQGGKRELMRITEIFEFLGWRPPEMEARNGTAGLTVPEEFLKI